MQKLCKYQSNVFGVVSESPAIIGNQFQDGCNGEGKPIMVTITNVIESRKERGIYADESKRRMWAKVEAN